MSKNLLFLWNTGRNKEFHFLEKTFWNVWVHFLEGIDKIGYPTHRFHTVRQQFQLSLENHWLKSPYWRAVVSHVDTSGHFLNCSVFETFPKAIYREGVFLKFWDSKLPSESNFTCQFFLSERNPLAMKKGNINLGIFALISTFWLNEGLLFL